MTGDHDHTDEDGQLNDKQTGFSFTRRGMLAAGAAGLAGASGTAGAQQDGEDNAPFAADDHDHSGDYLGESEPVEAIRSQSITSEEVNTTLYADSIAELKDHIATITDTEDNDEPMGAKIVLPRGELEASADQLPIELEHGVVIEGQGPYATSINVSGIGKHVFELDNANQTPLGRRVVLRDFQVTGGSAPEDGGNYGHQEPGSVGVYLDNVHAWWLQRCHFRNLEDGIVAKGSWNGTIEDCRLRFNSRDGIRALPNVQNYQTNLLRILNAQVSANGRHGIDAKEIAQMYVYGASVEGNREYGLRTDDVWALEVAGSYIESNGEALERDGSDGPVEIGLSPEGDDRPTVGVSVHDCYVHTQPEDTELGAGIKIGNAEHVDIANNTFSNVRDGSATGVELSESMSDIHVRSSNVILDERLDNMIRGPANGSNISPQELNSGVWKTSQFHDFEGLEQLCSDHVRNSALENRIEVVLTDDVSGPSRTINGNFFPAGTLFRGQGRERPTVESTGGGGADFAVSLPRERQKVSNLTVTSNGGVGVALSGSDTAAENLHITDTGAIGLRVYDDAVRSWVFNVVCTNVDSNRDIDVRGEGSRVIGCDGNIWTSEVSEVALAGNIDTSFEEEDDDSSDGDEDDTLETVHYEVANGTVTPDGNLETDGLSTWDLTEDGSLTELETGGSIGGEIWLSWDVDNLYFQAAIDDPAHLQSYEPGDMFRADAIQVAVAPGSDEWEEFLQYTFALNNDGTQAYGQIQPGSADAGVRSFDAQIVRDDAAEQTRYEIAIPWTELDALDEFDPATDDYLGVDWAVLDNDGEREDNIDRFVEWDVNGGSAITGGKEPDLLKVGHLAD